MKVALTRDVLDAVYIVWLWERRKELGKWEGQDKQEE